jgi:hypothetical protein
VATRSNRSRDSEAIEDSQSQGRRFDPCPAHVGKPCSRRGGSPADALSLLRGVLQRERDWRVHVGASSTSLLSGSWIPNARRTFMRPYCISNRASTPGRSVQPSRLSCVVRSTTKVRAAGRTITTSTSALVALGQCFARCSLHPSLTSRRFIGAFPRPCARNRRGLSFRSGDARSPLKKSWGP